MSDPRVILYLLIALSAVNYLFDQYLDYLNLRPRKSNIPPALSGYYDATKYQQSLDYHREETHFGFITAGCTAALQLLMLVFDGYGMLDAWLRTFIHNEITLALTFFAILVVAMDLLTLPFQWHHTFVIEAKYGFNRTTPRTFLLDKVKSYILGGALGGGLLAALIILIQEIGPTFWIWFGLVAAACILLLNLFYTSLILPLFNKLTELPDGPLKDHIRRFAASVKFPVENVYVMDGSRRSNKANAFFSGMGKKKKIVLFDTLLERHTPEELVAILAHEVGHYKKKHIVFGYVLSVAQLFFMLYVLSWLVYNPSVSLALGGHGLAIHLNLLAFAILYTPVSLAAGLFAAWYSRQNEFEADAFAIEHYPGPHLGTALKKLSVDHLSNLYPHPLYVFFHYSHPPLLERLEAMEGGR